MELIKDENATKEKALIIAKKIKNGGTVCLFGDLGTGKTFFCKKMALALNLDDFQIKSPTYTYIRKYQTKNIALYHIDLYRLEEIDELLLMEMEEIFENPQNIVMIEWADKLKEHLPAERIEIHLEYIDENKRGIRIKDFMKGC